MKVVSHSLLLEDCSSVKVIVVQNPGETTGSKAFFTVEMMYLLWNPRPPVAIDQGPLRF
jgi:hypothetical protein